MKDEIVILRIDEIFEKIETTQEGTFLYVDKEVLEEWLVEVGEMLERSCG